MNKSGMYNAVILAIFKQHYQPKITSFEFNREELEDVGTKLGLNPKNLGDVIYSFRFRRSLPKEILNTAPEGFEWIIEGAGKSVYRFRISRINRIIPRQNMIQIKIPDSTPEIIDMYSSGDEQALLTKIRYNRIIDLFLGITAYSLQNHLRTTVKGIGQIEIDEIYIGINNLGKHFVIPVQAKAGNDQISIVQTKQDIQYCAEKFPDIICRSISAQFMDNNLIAIFELTLEDSEVKVIDEKHYKLVSSEDMLK
jgi:hypothetical protein